LDDRQKRDNLQRLLRELRCYADTIPEGGSPATDGESQNLAAQMPLCHVTSSQGFQSISHDRRILSKRRLTSIPREPLPKQDFDCILGTDDDVFTFAGPARYPGRAAFLWIHPIETASSEEKTATPFDTGAVKDFLRPTDCESEQVAFVRSHEMPVPGYRSYLEHYLRVCFLSPWDYVSGTGPKVDGPIRVEGGDERRWTFEVRFRQELFIEEHLAAVVVPRALSLHSKMIEMTAHWKKMGAKVYSYDERYTLPGERLLALSEKAIAGIVRQVND
jgi:hypothetical protein